MRRGKRRTLTLTLSLLRKGEGTERSRKGEGTAIEPLPVGEGTAISLLRKEVIGNLIRAQLDEGRSVTLLITTGSMRPVLVPGDRVIVRTSGALALRLGDIVVAQAAETIVVHRLIGRSSSRDGPWLLTKGDNVTAADAPWPASQLLGVVLALERDGRRRDLRSLRARGAGAVVALVSRLQWVTYRRARGLAGRVFCRGLALVLRLIASPM